MVEEDFIAAARLKKVEVRSEEEEGPSCWYHRGGTLPRMGRKFCPIAITSPVECGFWISLLI